MPSGILIKPSPLAALGTGRLVLPPEKSEPPADEAYVLEAL